MGIQWGNGTYDVKFLLYWPAYQVRMSVDVLSKFMLIAVRIVDTVVTPNLVNRVFYRPPGNNLLI